MAASALHWTRTDGKKATLRSIYKKMQEYTQYAWHEDYRSFEATLQITQDYENDFLWFSKNDKAKWMKYANKRVLDPTVDVRENKMQM